MHHASQLPNAELSATCVQQLANLDFEARSGVTLANTVIEGVHQLGHRQPVSVIAMETQRFILLLNGDAWRQEERDQSCFEAQRLPAFLHAGTAHLY